MSIFGKIRIARRASHGSFKSKVKFAVRFAAVGGAIRIFKSARGK